jgi:hypothetical protein
MSPDWPLRIKVGFHDYILEDWPVVEAALAHRHGECDRNRKVIRVCRQFGDFKAAQTMLHEIMHACYCEYNIYDEDVEERTVGALSLALAAVWRDNPGVFAWIAAQIANEP